MKSYREFFAELKRRHVFKVAAIYGATAFVILQVADILFPALGLPAWAITFMVAILLLAFPVAIVVAWAFEVTPEGVKRTDAAAPGELEAIAAEPASKRWPAGVLALAGVAALVAGAWWAGARTAGGAGSDSAAADENGTPALALAGEDADPRPTIAVLPFADMSPESDQVYFSDGITEEILNTLAKIRELKVAARTSAFAFRGQELDMRAIGDSLGVEYLIEGSVRKAGDELRITAQLIDADDGSHLWSDSYDRTMDDVFAIQSEIAEAIAEELRVPLGLEDASDLVTPTGDLEAYDLYLAGRARVRERGAGLADARRLFRAAVASDSSWAPAWAGLAHASEVSIWYPESWDVRPANLEAELEYVDALQDEALAAAERAIALDPDMAAAHVAIGSVARNRRDWERSEQAYRTALSLDPDDAEAHQQYAEMLGNVGRIAEKRVAARRALDLDPAPIRYMEMASALWADGDTDGAIEIAERGIAADPGGGVRQLRWLRTAARLSRGDVDVAVDPGFVELTQAEQDSVVTAYRREDPAALPSIFANSVPLGTALLYARMGRPAEASAALRARLATWPYGNLVVLWLAPFDPIRSSPAFEGILAEYNLAGRTVQRTAVGANEASAP